MLGKVLKEVSNRHNKVLNWLLFILRLIQNFSRMKASVVDFIVLSGKLVMSVMYLKEWAMGSGGSTYIVDWDLDIFLSDRHLIYLLFGSGQTKYLNDNFKALSRGIFALQIVCMYIYFLWLLFFYLLLLLDSLNCSNVFCVMCSVLLSHFVDNYVDYQVLRWLKKIILFLRLLH